VKIVEFAPTARAELEPPLIGMSGSGLAVASASTPPSNARCS